MRSAFPILLYAPFPDAPAAPVQYVGVEHPHPRTFLGFPRGSAGYEWAAGIIVLGVALAVGWARMRILLGRRG